MFELQGHRGARGLRPENTLPSFEAAFDARVSSIETDVHLTRDGIPVLIHDAELNDRVHGLLSDSASPLPEQHPKVRELSLAQLRGYRADGNPDSNRFPAQVAVIPSLTQAFCQQIGIDPYGIPTLGDLLAFTAAYAGELGQAAGKSADQRQRATRVRFDLELKRVPFHPENIGDDFTGGGPGLLEKQLVGVVRQAGVVDRTCVRSFDHRAVAGIRALEPALTTALLTSNTALLHPGQLTRLAGAHIYGPDYLFLDQLSIRQAHEEGIRVIPWTVNVPEDWQRLLDWGVDGITTDYPDSLAVFLTEKGIAY